MLINGSRFLKTRRRPWRRSFHFEAKLAKEMQPQQTARQHRHDRTYRSRQDDADGDPRKLLAKHNPRKVSFSSFDSVDNAPEEKARGITITDFALSNTRQQIGIMRTWIAPATPITSRDMITGAAQMDGAIIAEEIAATDGPNCLELREHILLARQVSRTVSSCCDEQSRMPWWMTPNCSIWSKQSHTELLDQISVPRATIFR